jgi:diguanylate cyclase (GGDEF)-like protein
MTNGLSEKEETGSDSISKMPFRCKMPEDYKTLSEIIKELEKENDELKIQIKELEKENIKLNELSTIDYLTGVYSKRGLETDLERVLRKCYRDKKPLGVLFIDLRHMSLINKFFGHITGDYILKDSADILKKDIRADDSLGRYGGDEFVVSIYDSTEKELKDKKDKIKYFGLKYLKQKNGFERNLMTYTCFKYVLGLEYNWSNKHKLTKAEKEKAREMVNIKYNDYLDEIGKSKSLFSVGEHYYNYERLKKEAFYSGRKTSRIKTFIKKEIFISANRKMYKDKHDD